MEQSVMASMVLKVFMKPTPYINLSFVGAVFAAACIIHHPD
jgi:hypothetical protein